MSDAEEIHISLKVNRELYEWLKMNAEATRKPIAVTIKNLLEHLKEETSGT